MIKKFNFHLSSHLAQPELERFDDALEDGYSLIACEIAGNWFTAVLHKKKAEEKTHEQ